MLKTNAQIVAALTDQYPQIKTRGFLKELRAAFAGRQLRHNCIRGFNRVPDGYVIDAPARRIDLFEAEATHPLPTAALDDYIHLWHDFGCYGVTVNLYVVSRLGHINAVDMSGQYLLMISRSELCS